MCIEDAAHLNCHPFSPNFSHFSPFSPVLLRDLCYRWMVDYDDGNHWTSCTFTTQQIGRWVVAQSIANSNLHGHCIANSRKQCLLWSPFMSQHLNPSSALSDHCESVAWLINDGPHGAAYCYKFGPNRVKAECLCPRKAATIFQHAHATADCAWPQPPTTKDIKTLVMPA